MALVFAFAFEFALLLLGLETGELGDEDEGEGLGRSVAAVGGVRVGLRVVALAVRSDGGKVIMGGRKRCLRELGRGTLGKVYGLKVDER